MPAATEVSADDLVGQLYSSLRDIAHRERLRAGRPQTLQTTALISETYVKLSRHGQWESREHFLATAAKAMRHVLVDNARARIAQKRGGGQFAVDLQEAEEATGSQDLELLRLDEALAALEQQDARLAAVVECRFFAGYTDEETARVLKISDRTVRRDWLQARAWLYREMTSDD